MKLNLSLTNPWRGATRSEGLNNILDEGRRKIFMEMLKYLRIAL